MSSIFFCIQIFFSGPENVLPTSENCSADTHELTFFQVSLAWRFMILAQKLNVTNTNFLIPNFSDDDGFGFLDSIFEAFQKSFSWESSQMRRISGPF